jgi:uncharacterized protein (TIGR02118 family)
MHKLMLSFAPPSDIGTFEDRWSEEFVPAVEKMPGIRRISVTRVTDVLRAQAEVYLIHEVYFDGRQELRSALNSAEGQRAGEVIANIAGDFVTINLAEHLEEDR